VVCGLGPAFHSPAGPPLERLLPEEQPASAHTRSGSESPEGRCLPMSGPLGDVTRLCRVWATWRFYQRSNPSINNTPSAILLSRTRISQADAQFSPGGSQSQDAEGRNVFRADVSPRRPGQFGVVRIAAPSCRPADNIDQADGNQLDGEVNAPTLIRHRPGLAQHNHVYEDCGHQFFGALPGHRRSDEHIGVRTSGLWYDDEQFSSTTCCTCPTVRCNR